MTDDRLRILAEWGLSPSLIGLAQGHLPHPAFRAKCQPLQAAARRARFGIELNRPLEPGPSGKKMAVALWEFDIGDGHAFEVLYCENGPNGVEFWNVTYADDIEKPQAQLIAKSEQGVCYWLFYFLIGSEFFAHGERAYATLVAAANAVGFRYLKDVLALEEEIGSASDYPALLSAKSVKVRESCN